MKALPDPDFKYRSKLYAWYLSGNAEAIALAEAAKLRRANLQRTASAVAR